MRRRTCPSRPSIRTSSTKPRSRLRPLNATIRPVAAVVRAPGGVAGSAARDEPLDFRVRDAVMAAGGVRRADPSLVDPLFQRRVADSEPVGRRANGEERHDDSAFRWDPGINLNRITTKRFDTNVS